MPSPLGTKIRERRLHLELSLERLAELTGSSKSYVWELENREKTPNPSVDKLVKLATALEVTLEFFLTNEATSADSDVLDQAFFRKYQQLDGPKKAKLRKFIDVFNEDD